MTTDAIIEAGNREFAQLDDTERDKLMEAVLDHLKVRFARAVMHAWVVCEALDGDPTTLVPETIAFIAAMDTIPADAEHPVS